MSFLSVLDVVEPPDAAIALIEDPVSYVSRAQWAYRCSPGFTVQSDPQTGVKCGGRHCVSVGIATEHEVESKARALQAGGNVRQDFGRTIPAIMGSKCFPKYFFTFFLRSTFLLLSMKFTFSFHTSGSTFTLTPSSLMYTFFPSHTRLPSRALCLFIELNSLSSAFRFRS